jgi:hypothetical protein
MDDLLVRLIWIIDELFLQGPKGDISQASPRSSSQANSQNQAGPLLNFGSHRKGILYSHDSRNIRLLSDESAADIPGSNANAQKAIRALTSQPLTQPQAERLKQQEQKGKVPIIGIEKVRDLALNDPLGGLNYFFKKTTGDPDVPTPKDRASYISWYLRGQKFRLPCDFGHNKRLCQRQALADICNFMNLSPYCYKSLRFLSQVS